MEEFNKIVTFSFNQELAKQDIPIVQFKLEAFDGIDSVIVTPNSVSVDYVTLKLSEKSVRDILKGLGYSIAVEKKKRPRVLKRLIENLAASNKKTYGDKRLDCCDLKHSN